MPHIVKLPFGSASNGVAKAAFPISFIDPKPVRAGQIRGFSAFAPVFVHAAQLQGTSEAHVVAKRAQA